MYVGASTTDHLHCEFVHLLFLQTHRETDLFFTSSGVHLTQSNQQYHYRRSVFCSQIKSKVGHILPKSEDQCINLNIDDSPITSRSHTHPSHSQTSLLLTSSLSLGVPVPRSTQCKWVVYISQLSVLVSPYTDTHISILLNSRFVSS